MSKSQNTSKPRQPKLRASCDGCFLAKVKCSKERPICSRCLTTGAECGYSPSCRTGKSKSIHTLEDQMLSREMSTGLHEAFEDPAITYTGLNSEIYSGDSPLYGIHPSWTMHGTMNHHRSSVSSSTPSMVRDTSSTPESSADTTYETPYWNPDLGSSTSHFQPAQRSKSREVVFPSLEPLFEGQEMFMLNSHSMLAKPAYMSNNNSSCCNCFNSSLQALQSLHNFTQVSTPVPSFDIVLTINRRAIDTCTNMLSCTYCSNSNTTIMLLATIIGKVISFYRAASHNYFTQQESNRQQVILSFGSYKVEGEDGRWLEMEILLRELGKLEGVLGMFGDLGKGTEDRVDGHVRDVVVGYLRQALRGTFEVLDRNGGLTGR